jgi:putative ABC transport system permease protein
MNIAKLSLQNILNRPLNTLLSIILIMLGVGLISLMLQLNEHVQQQMESNLKGVDMVVGAKGSPLQLVLSAIYHIDAPTGNIPLSEVKQLSRNPLVQEAVPLSYGDSHKGFRIVGTDRKYPELYHAALKEGNWWGAPFEVTVGAIVSNQLNLTVGDKFYGSHGLAEGGESHKENAYKVVGIMAPTHSALDQLILTATESVWEVHHHEETDHTESGAHGEEQQEDDDHQHQHHHENEHEEEDKAITALLVKVRNPLALMKLPRSINERTSMQAALPKYEINRLLGLMGVGVEALNGIAFAVILVSGLSVFISLYTALKARQPEMALMRSYGASRWQLLRLVVQEGLLLMVMGCVLGILASRLGLLIIGNAVNESFHYSFSISHWLAGETLLVVATIVVGFLAALFPAIKAFRLNISKTLSHA